MNLWNTVMELRQNILQRLMNYNSKEICQDLEIKEIKDEIVNMSRSRLPKFSQDINGYQ